MYIFHPIPLIIQFLISIVRSTMMSDKLYMVVVLKKCRLVGHLQVATIHRKTFLRRST